MNHSPKQDFYANYQCENESTKQVLYSYKQSNMPPDSFFFSQTGFTWLSVKQHIHFITSCALFAYQCRHEPEYIVGPLFSSTCSDLCSQHFCILSLAKTLNAQAHQSEGGRNSYGYDSFSFFVSTMQTLNTWDSVVFASPLFPPTFRSDVPVPNSQPQIKCQT